MFETFYIGYFEVLAFILGTMVGSFLGVCIYRIPRGLNFVRPASRCGKCGFPLAFYDNIPLVSFLLLRGRCRHCGVGYGVRHLWIELFTGMLALVLYQQWGLSFFGVFYFVLGCLLIVISVIDIDFQIIPDSMTLAPWGLGLFLALVFSAQNVFWFVSISQALVGSFVGAGTLWLVAYGYQALTGVDGMGLGDVKLIGFFGAFFGLTAVWVTIFVGSFIGALFGVVWLLFSGKNKRTPIPFGPFLCLGLVFYLMGYHHYFLERFF